VRISTGITATQCDLLGGRAAAQSIAATALAEAVKKKMKVS